MTIITLLTDFGSADYYAGAVKGVLSVAAPAARLIDLSHSVRPGDLDQAAFILGAAWSEYPPGTVHLAVVDPGVGSTRRLLAATASGHFFVAPDNGLLHHVLPYCDSVRAVIRSRLFLDRSGRTFDGRDRFAPIAAYLARGEPLDGLGAEVSDSNRLEMASPRRDDHQLRGHVVHIDRFGNLISDIPSTWLLPGARFRASIGRLSTASRATHYGDIAPGAAAILAGSLGTLELSRAGESAADYYEIRRGDELTVEIG